MLTIDSIMRGPEARRHAAVGVRWSKDSRRSISRGRTPSDERSATYVVNRDGTGLKQLTAEEARNLDVPQTGRFDRARRRLLTAEGGDVVIYDAATGARRLRHADGRRRNATRAGRATTRPSRSCATATCIWSSLEAATTSAFAQLTDIVVPAGDAGRGAGAAAAGGRGAAAGARRRAQAAVRGAGGGAARIRPRRSACLREQERAADRVHPQAGRGAAAGAAAAAARWPRAAAPAAAARRRRRFARVRRSARADARRSPVVGRRALRLGRRDRAARRHRARPGHAELRHLIVLSRDDSRPHERRRRAVAGACSPMLDVQGEQDASGPTRRAFAGVERKAKPGRPRRAAACSTGRRPTSSDDGADASSRCASLDNKDRWFVKVDPATGKATVLDGLHDDAWIREQRSVGRRAGSAAAPASRGCRTTSASCSCRRRPATCTCYSLDMTAATPAGDARSRRGKWEVTSAQLSSDRTDAVPDDERSASRASGTSTRCRWTAARARRITTTTGLERRDGVARREVARASSTPTAPNRRSCT